MKKITPVPRLENPQKQFQASLLKVHSVNGAVEHVKLKKILKINK